MMGLTPEQREAALRRLIPDGLRIGVPTDTGREHGPTSRPMSATLRRIERGHFCHGDTRDLSVRYEGSYLRLSIAQAMALVELLPAGSRLAESLRTDAACALREDHGMSWERACALVEGQR